MKPAPSSNRFSTNSSLVRCLFVIFPGISLGLAWLRPGSSCAAILGMLAAFGIVALVHAERRSIVSLGISGVLAYAIGTFWFYDSVRTFSAATPFVAALLTFPFLIWQVLQFMTFALIYRSLSPTLSLVGVRAAFAWVPLEWIWPSLFPVSLGNTQLGFTLLSQSAELVGLHGLSFLILWICELLYLSIFSDRGKYRLLSIGTVMLGLLTFGALRINDLRTSELLALKVGVIQAHRSSEEVTDQKLMRLSESIIGSAQLIVWPERALDFSVHESIGARKNDSRLPRFSKDIPLITGAMTFRPPRKTFNSVLLIQGDGTIPVPYHKRVLMPFGEFLPIPFLFDLAGLSAFAPTSTHVAGTEPTVFDVHLDATGRSVRIAPFVCYEDLRSDLSTLAAALGASMFLDLSAGAWASSELSLHQHQTLAAFRAIESRRSLLRVSAYGPSALVDPMGRVHSIFEAKEEGAKIVQVPLQQKAPLNSWLRRYLPHFLSLLAAISAWSEYRRRQQGRSAQCS